MLLDVGFLGTVEQREQNEEWVSLGQTLLFDLNVNYAEAFRCCSAQHVSTFAAARMPCFLFLPLLASSVCVFF